MYTLVLNASYEVIKIVHWKRAITWFFLDKVDIIEEYDQYIKTVNVKIKIPAVVKYKYLVKPKYRKMRFTKKNIFARDKFICQYCGNVISVNKLTIDHVIPKFLNGKTNWTNCVSCCINCNSNKSNKTLKESGMKLIKEPKQPSQIDAFVIYIRLRTISVPEIWGKYNIPQYNY